MASLLRVFMVASLCFFAFCLGCGKGTDSANVSDKAVEASDQIAEAQNEDQAAENSPANEDLGSENLSSSDDLDWDDAETAGNPKRSVPGTDVGGGESVAPPTGFGPDDIVIFANNGVDDSDTTVEAAEGEQGEAFSLELIEVAEPGSGVPNP